MQIINKKYFKICIIVIFISLVIGYLFLLSKGNNIQKDNIIYNDKMFAYMLEECNGSNCEYKESKTNAWPNVGYIYNSSLSMCIDAKGNSLTGILSYDNRLNIAKLTNTKSSTYCVLYFDKDNKKPVIKDFYVNNSNGYIAGRNVSGYVTWDDDDVISYCISTTNNASSCEWKDASGKRVDYTADIGNGTGDVTIYAFIKDTANNISDSKNYNVKRDAIKPTIKNFHVDNTDGLVSNQTTTGYITWDDNDVVEYCINTTNSTSGCSWKSTTNKRVDFTYNLSGQGSITLYAFIKDAGGLVSDSKNYTIALDKEGPTVNIVNAEGHLRYRDWSGNVHYEEIVVTLNISDSFSDIKSYTVSIQGSSNTVTKDVSAGTKSLTNQTISISPISTSCQTIEVYAIDSLGNKGPVITQEVCKFTNPCPTCFIWS